MTFDKNNITLVSSVDDKIQQVGFLVEIFTLKVSKIYKQEIK